MKLSVMKYIRNNKKSFTVMVVMFCIWLPLSILDLFRGTGYQIFALIPMVILFVYLNTHHFKQELLKELKNLHNQEENHSDELHEKLIERIENLERLQGKTVKNLPRNLSDEL